MNKYKTTLSVMALACGLGLTSCGDFAEDLTKLGRRVEVLEDSSLHFEDETRALKVLVAAAEGRDNVVSVVDNGDGSYTLTFEKGGEFTLSCGTVGKDGIDGQNGREASEVIGVRKGDDGLWYWTFAGEWIKDENGNKVIAGGIDGKDGCDGHDGHDGVDGVNGHDGRNGVDGTDGRDGRDGVDGQDGKDGKDATEVGTIPQVRINPTTNEWEVSLDNGSTWNSTGVKATGPKGDPGEDGRDGTNGQNGQNGHNGRDGLDGTPSVFKSVTVVGGYVIFILTDDTIITLSVSEEFKA